MFKNLENYQLFTALILISILLATFLFLPVHVQLASVIILLTGIGLTTVLIFQKHWHTYQQAECTREKMTRNLVFDITGLLLTMGAAMYVGRLAGGYFGIRSGFWIGLLAGFLGGFFAAWMVRSVWGRLISTLV